MTIQMKAPRDRRMQGQCLVLSAQCLVPEHAAELSGAPAGARSRCWSFPGVPLAALALPPANFRQPSGLEGSAFGLNDDSLRIEVTQLRRSV